MHINKKSLYSFLSVITFLIGFLTIQAQEVPGEKDILIPLHPSDTLLIIYGENMIQEGMDQQINSSRFGYFQQAITEEFKKANLLAQVEFTQLGFDKTIEADYILNITITNWEINTLGEYECQFFASISDNEQKKDLGSFIGKEKSLTLQGSNQAEIDFVKAARKAVEKLMAHFLNS